MLVFLLSWNVTFMRMCYVVWLYFFFVGFFFYGFTLRFKFTGCVGSQSML